MTRVLWRGVLTVMLLFASFATASANVRGCCGTTSSLWAGDEAYTRITLVTSTDYEDCAARHAEESSRLQSVRDRYDTSPNADRLEIEVHGTTVKRNRYIGRVADERTAA